MNVGGIFSFQYIPYFQIVKLPTVTGKLITTPLGLNSGYTLLSGYSTLGETEFEENQKSDPNGPYYEWKLTGFVPGDSPDLIGLMEEMELVQHLVITRDTMNKRRMVGYDAPLDFSASFQSGGKPGEARGYKFSFTGLSTKRAPVYALG